MEERKVVTVLFADLVGFTARAEQLDPEDVRALLRPYHERARAELERFGGTVEKFIGDAVMAVFGAPVAHEDDPERAVRAALSLRDAVAELNESEPSPELEVRIAVHSGEALVTVDADPSRGEGIVAGDVVNTASRLQSFAPVNGVLVGEPTYTATRHAIEFEEASTVQARGKSEPLRVWHALNPVSRIGTDPRRESAAPLVGRAREVDQLRDALARMREQESVQLVTIVGVPGIGKSRLVRELLAHVDENADLIRWRQGRSLPYGDGVTFWALGEIVKAEAGIFETDAADVSEAKLQRAVDQAVDDARDATRVVKHLRPLVGLTSDDVRAEGRGEAFAAWRRFLEGLADDGPTVLVFEDLHWADDSLLDFVDELVDQAVEVPLLVVATARPELVERRPSWGGGKRNAATISLAPLSEEDTARLLSSLLDTPLLAADLQARVLARAEGNPLFTEEYARLLEEGGNADELPGSLHALIAARLDALSPDEKAVVQAAAVVGETFWAGAAAAVAASPGAEEILRSLERKEFVRRRRRTSVEGEAEYAFHHVLVRDVAHSQIPRAERAERHARAARWIELIGRAEDQAEMLAHHYLQALELSRAAGRDVAELETRARSALVDAGDRAYALGAVVAAARFYEAALELTAPGEAERPFLLLRYGRARGDDTAMDPALLDEAYEGFIEQGEAGPAAETKMLLATLWWARGESKRAREHQTRAAELVAEEPESSSKVFVLTQIARYQMLAAEYETAQTVASEAAEMAQRLGLPALVPRNLNTAGICKIYAGDAGGLDDLQNAVDFALSVNDVSEAHHAQSNLTWMYVVRGDVRHAFERFLVDRAAVERLGIAPAMLWERGERLFYLYWRGEWEELERAASDFLAEVGDGGHYLEAQAWAQRARVAFARGDADAIEQAERSVAHGRGADDPQILDGSAALLARLRAESGDLAGATSLFDELMQWWRKRDPEIVFAPIEAAWAAVALGRQHELAQVLEPVENVSRWVAAGLAIAAGDFVEAAETAAEIGLLPDEAHARSRAAEELVRAGRRAEADAQLAQALAFWRSVGASRYVREGEALLARAG